MLLKTQRGYDTIKFYYYIYNNSLLGRGGHSLVLVTDTMLPLLEPTKNSTNVISLLFLDANKPLSVHDTKMVT